MAALPVYVPETLRPANSAFKFTRRKR
jgi:hypothetical protein